MKNITDSSIRFSVITEGSLIQSAYLDASLNESTQYTPYIPGNTYVVQEIESTSIEDVLVAERSGEDLILALYNQESSQPHLVLENFFAHNGQLHQMTQDGEFIRTLSAEDNPQQGPATFNAESLGHIEQQPQHLALSLLHEAPVAGADGALPQSTEAVPAMLNIAPLMLDNAPTITHALDNLGARQGILKSGNVTDDQWSVLEGTGTPGATLEITDNGRALGEVIVGDDGKWSFTPSEKYSESGHVLVARDKASGLSSDNFALIVDSVAPSRAVIDSISSDNNGSTLIGKNGYTNDNTPLIKGRAEALSVVGIYDGKTMIGTALADPSGAWEFSSIFTFPDGTYTISAKAIDFAGNTGLGSSTYTITIDTIPPAVPTIQQAFDNFGSQQGILGSGDLTDDRTPTLSGKAEAGVTVFINNNGKQLGTAEADPNGDWSFTPKDPLPDGEYHFTASARDKAGNTSNAESDVFTLVLGEDRTSTPTIDSLTDDVGSIQGLLKHGDQTDDATPTLRGKAQAGDTVKIFDNGHLLGETTAAPDGSWSFTPAPPLEEGQHAFQVQAFNAIHSPSELSPAFEIVLDLTPPDASNLRITGIYDDVGSITGNVVQGGRTDDQNPTLSGTGPVGETVIVYVTDAKGQREIGRAQVSNNGTWTLEVDEALSLGAHTFTAVAIDAAGNATPHSPGYKVTITTNDTVGGFDLGGNQTSGASINTTVVGAQNNPQVTKLTNGNLVVTWQGDNGGYDVYMQLMDPTGTQKIGREQLVNQRQVNNQDSPQVVALADGGFLVVFESYQASALDNSGDSIFARKYSADGAAQTDEFLVNKTTAGAQRSPSALALPDGGYIVSWYSDQSGSSIVQRIYGADNNPVSNEFVIKTGGASSQYGGPEMVLFEDGEHAGWYLTVWSGLDNSGNGVLGQLRTIDGSIAGPILTLNTTSDNLQQFPDVIALKDGSFIVMWDSNDSKAIGSDIRAAHYSFDPVTGTTTLRSNGDFIVNEYRAGKQYKPVGVALEDGGYMLFWGSEGGDGDGSAIFAQRFDANSNKIGHEFLVNPTTWGNQGSGWDNIDLSHILDATLMDNGNIFVTWHSDKIDPSGFGIEGVVIDIDAGFYSEFQVNNVITGNQTNSATTALHDGNFMVVWTSQDAGNPDIKGQLLNEQGMPIGPEILLSQNNKAYQQIDPAITTLADGTFVVTWSSTVGAVNSISMAHYRYSYDDNGQVIGTERIGNEQTITPTSNGTWVGASSITPLDDGGYLVTWRKGQTNTTIVSRQYDANDQAVTGEIVAGPSLQTNSGAESATLTNGNVAIAYCNTANGSDIWVQVYNPVTHTYGKSFTANQTLAGAQDAPSITALANGNFVVAWNNNNNSGVDQSGRSVFARMYSAEGQSLGNEFIVNTYTLNHQQQPILKANPSGGFVAVYESQADIAPGAGTFGIYLQFFDDNGNRVGQEMQINQLMVGNQQEPDITFLADGRLFVTWTDYGVGDGSYSSIKGRIIDLDGTLGHEVTLHGSNQNTTALLALADDADHGSLWMLLDDGSTSGLMLSGESLSAVRGGEGNDVIGMTNTSFTSIHGGEGIDTLLLDGKNMALDLDALVGRITGIEKIDLGQGSANSLSLSTSALDELGQTNMMIADGKNQLVINGDGSNALQLVDTQSDSWLNAGEAEIGGVVYHTYVAGATELLVEQNIHVTIM